MEYAIFVSRLTSFKNWPSGHVVSPNALARAGLFYTGFKDRVRCFYCGLGLVSWEIGDDPWIEHARHSPECTYVQRNKPPTSNGTERQMSADDNEVTAPGIPSQSNVSLEAKQTDALDDNNHCRICLDNRSIIVFLPCGHLVSCAECAPALKLCPICRADIRGTVRAFLP
ncbi:putative inhibitor of apoptosis [Mya arenaria]|uniref:putative inhibitor of apoptosis n=1 Tax=Mya arenaria TaxID=6604 RepID=UPI0022E72385|nr:putative inhibitor of apoptosis [Mya arenaria]